MPSACEEEGVGHCAAGACDTKKTKILPGGKETHKPATPRFSVLWPQRWRCPDFQSVPSLFCVPASSIVASEYLFVLLLLRWWRLLGVVVVVLLLLLLLCCCCC